MEYVLEHKIDKIGERIKWIRNHLKESEIAFSKRLRISKPTLRKYESGEESPRCSELIYLTNSVNNLNIFWLIMGIGEPFGVENINDKNEIIRLLMRSIESLHIKIDKIEDRIEPYNDKTLKGKAGSE